MKKNWVQSGNDFFLQEVSQNKELLPGGIYKINEHPVTKDLFLTQVQDKFSFPYKVYGVEAEFVNRMKKTYENTNGNLGILMNGVKGTGKTVTAQQVCNILNLPVLIVHEPYNNLSSFINELQQDVIVFFDEYEKMYNNYDSSILTVMDGVLNNEHRKVFLLTTNSLYLNDNLLQRPGRLRYIKTFSDLTLDVIMEVVDDKLKHKAFRKECIEFISRLETITIDIVKAVIEEVNIHNEAPEKFKDIFNIKAITNRVNVWVQDKVAGSLTRLEKENCTISPVKFTEDTIEEEFYIGGREIGTIKQVLSEDQIIVELYDRTDGDDEALEAQVQTYRIERLDTKHSSFTKYPF